MFSIVFFLPLKTGSTSCLGYNQVLREELKFHSMIPQNFSCRNENATFDLVNTTYICHDNWIKSNTIYDRIHKQEIAEKANVLYIQTVREPFSALMSMCNQWNDTSVFQKPAVHKNLAKIDPTLLNRQSLSWKPLLIPL